MSSNNVEGRYTIHSVLAGAYKGGTVKAMRLHASTDGGWTAVCGGIKEENLCDEYGTPAGASVDCPACMRKIAKLGMVAV